MSGATKLMTAGGGGVSLTPASSIASDVTVNLPVTGVSGGTLVCSDSSGNVGIGTSSPSVKLEVADNVKINGANPALRFLNGDAAEMYIQCLQVANGGRALRIFDSAAGAERMRIDSSGNVLFCKSSSSATVVGSMAFPSGEFYSSLSNSTNVGNTTLNVYSIGASAYRFYVGMGGTVYATNTTISGISDQRYKENVRNLDDGLNAILALKPRKFDWKEGKGKDIKNDRGFIAQEFEQVFPDLIDEWKDPAPEGEEPYKSVRQDLIPVLVKAIQELSAKNDALEARIAALEAK